jgi:hypothetical protein
MLALMYGWLGTPSTQSTIATEYRTLEALVQSSGGVLVTEPAAAAETPAEALVRAARTCGAAEIVVGCEPLGRFRAVNGSLAQDLLALADRPVVVVPRHETGNR